MRPATARRLLVLGVCTVGVTTLYLAPSFGRSGDQSARGAQDPSVVPAATGTAKRVTLAADRRPVGSSERPPAAQAPSSLPVTADTGIGPGAGGSLSAGAMADEPGQAVDSVPPSAIRDISFPEVRSDRLMIRWAAATDDVAVTAYRVWLNGFEVADTTGLQVSVPWFRDGSRQQVVEVRAVDAAGNQSAQALAVLIPRPLAPTPAASGRFGSIPPHPSGGPDRPLPSPATTTPSGRPLDADG